MKINIPLLLISGLVMAQLNARVYYISNAGDDTNPGTRDEPFQTIQRGADLAMPGDTVWVLQGVYRERVTPPRGGAAGNPITYKGEPGKQVTIKGSDIWEPAWERQSGNVFYAVPDESMFNDDSYVDDKNPFRVAVSSTPYGRNGKPEVERGYGGDPNLVLSIGQVFVNGKMYTQKGYLSEVINSAESWFYHRPTGIIYIHFPDTNPARHVVEISTRRRIFAPHQRRLGYIVVEGFIMEHCGNQYPTNFWEVGRPEWQQAGALGTRSGHNWVIRHNVIRLAHGIGIDFGNEGNANVDLERGNNGLATGARRHIIDGNFIIDNGGGGTAAYFPRDILFINNVIERNNRLGFTGQKRWESAGVKMHGPHASIIANNLIRNNFGKWGLWLDQGSGNGTVVRGNLIVANEVGFDLEIGTAYKDKLVLDHNLFFNNTIAIATRESGGITAFNNLIVDSTDSGIVNTINRNREGSWSSDHHYYFNNVLIGNPVNLSIMPPDFYRSDFRQFDHNVYQELSGGKSFRFLYTFGDFSYWKNQWNTYNQGTHADLNSTLNNGLSASLDEATWMVQLNLNDAFFLSGVEQHSMVRLDYHGVPIPVDGSAVPGPFQNLVVGTNTLPVWTGLRPLAAYESPKFVTVAGIPIAWLQANGLSTDGSDDMVDSDGDGRNNLVEWIQGTDPNAFDAGLQLVIAVTQPDGEFELQWQAVEQRKYSLYRTHNLMNPDWQLVTAPVFAPVNQWMTQSIAGDPLPAFYRAEVEVLDHGE